MSPVFHFNPFAKIEMPSEVFLTIAISAGSALIRLAVEHEMMAL